MFLLMFSRIRAAVALGEGKEEESALRRVVDGGKREKFFIRIARNPLKSPDFEKINASK